MRCLVGSVADRERHLCAGSIAERIALSAQCVLETRVLHRRRLQLIDERLHFDERLVRARPDGACRGASPALVCVQPRFDGCRRRLNGEELLLDRVMEIPRQSCAFFTAGGLANLRLVSRAQHIDARLPE